MPTVNEITKAVKKLKRVKNPKMANKPMLPSSRQLLVYKTDPQVLRNKQAKMAMIDAEKHMKKYLKSMNKVYKLLR